MTSSAVEIVCMTLGVIGLIGVISCCALPHWKLIVFRGSNGIPEVEYHYGLWMACVKPSSRQQECRMFDVLPVIVPAYLHPARPMIVISCMLSGISLLFLFFGVIFTTCVQNEDANPKISLTAGVGLLLAGLMVIFPVSWVANIVNDMNKVDKSVERKIGASIYIGWVAGVLLVLAGSLLCYFRRTRSSSSGGTAIYYSNSVSAPNNNVI